MFPNATSVSISGGRLCNVEGNQVILNIGRLEVTIASDEPGKFNYELPPQMLSNYCLAQIARQAKALEVDPANTSSISVFRQPCFDVVKELLKVTIQLLKVCPAKFAHLIRRDVAELADTVGFYERAHKASTSTTLFPLFNRQAVTRMEYCVDTLRQVHNQISRLPYPSIPSWTERGMVLLGWFLNKDQIPDDIVAIRLDIMKETEFLGADLGSLKTVAWVEGLWSFAAQNGLFTMQELTRFLTNRSRSLHSIRVEEIILLEPLGQSLSVPLRFVDSLEDIHCFLQLGCQGSLGGTYIDNRSYQLDESITNATIDEQDPSTYLVHGTVLEVSIRLRINEAQSSRCPRCGVSNHQLAKESWIRCKGCRLLFSLGVTSTTSTISSGRNHQEEKPSNPSLGGTAINVGGTSRTLGAPQDEDPELAAQKAYDPEKYCFRRVKLEAVISKGRGKTKMDEVKLNGDSGSPDAKEEEEKGGKPPVKKKKKSVKAREVKGMQKRLENVWMEKENLKQRLEELQHQTEESGMRQTQGVNDELEHTVNTMKDLEIEIEEAESEWLENEYAATLRGFRREKKRDRVRAKEDMTARARARKMTQHAEVDGLKRRGTSTKGH